MSLYTNLLWLSAYIYGYIQPHLTDLSDAFSKATKVTKATYNNIYNYFTNNTNVEDKKDDSNVSVFVSDGSQMVPFSFDISKLHKHHLLYYVVVKIDDTHDKVVVFNSLDKLIFLYNNLQDLVKSRMSKFSKYLEVRITNNTTVDHLDTFSEYTDRSETYYSDISGYKIRAKDIYDFYGGSFLLSRGDRLNVTKMDLSSHEYHCDEELC
jgi:hypothetical protein